MLRALPEELRRTARDALIPPPTPRLALAEIQSSKEMAAQPLPLDDTPYEPEEEGTTTEGEGAPWPPGVLAARG